MRAPRGREVRATARPVGGDSGMVSLEVALALPLVLLAGLVGLGVSALGVQQLRAETDVVTAARAVARGAEVRIGSGRVTVRQVDIVAGRALLRVDLTRAVVLPQPLDGRLQVTASATVMAEQ